MNSGPRRRGALSASEIATVIDELKAASLLRTVVFAGGEPTVLKGELLIAIRKAKEQGLVTRLVTNASWATTSGRANEKLKELKDAGLDEINISADDFHLPFIPFSRVKTLWQAAKNHNFMSVIIANCYGPDSVVNPDWIEAQLGEVLPVRFDDDGKGVVPNRKPGETYFGLSNARLQRLRDSWEKHTSQRIDYVDQATLNQKCPYAGRSIALTPDGHLAACCGFEFDAENPLKFASIRQANAKDSLRKSYDSVLLNAIAEVGPYFLMRFLQKFAPEVPFRRDYGSICEICFDVTARPIARQALHANMERLAGMVVRALTR